MIPANGTYYVHFQDSEGQFTSAKPVVAWDDDGRPLIAGRYGLELAADAGLGAIRGIRQASEAVVGAVPGGGWLIDCTDDEGVSWTLPILAWTIHADGAATPLTTDADGVTSDATEGLASYRIHHPQDRLPPAEPTG